MLIFVTRDCFVEHLVLHRSYNLFQISQYHVRFRANTPHTLNFSHFGVMVVKKAYFDFKFADPLLSRFAWPDIRQFLKGFKLAYLSAIQKKLATSSNVRKININMHAYILIRKQCTCEQIKSLI